MQQKHVPVMDVKYWLALGLASIFGANTGDFLADVVGLGHISGLPILAIAFAAVLAAERFDRLKNPVYFWAAIIVIRTSATNIGDISGDLDLSRPLVIGILCLALFATVLVWYRYNLKKSSGLTGEPSGSLATVPVYWFAMLLAGTLGTVLGDFCSFSLMDLINGGHRAGALPPPVGADGKPNFSMMPHTGFSFDNLYAALILSVPLVILFFVSRKDSRQTHLFWYWSIVVFIRSAGTAMGDFLAHSPMGLATSTLVTGCVFVLFLVFFPTQKNSNYRNVPAMDTAFDYADSNPKP